MIHNTWFLGYKTEEELNHQSKEGTAKFQVSHTSGAGFYTYSHHVEEIPIMSHHMCCKRVGQSMWTHHKLALSSEVLDLPPAPPGYIMYDNLLAVGDCIDVGKVVSGGLVHLLQ